MNEGEHLLDGENLQGAEDRYRQALDAVTSLESQVPVAREAEATIQYILGLLLIERAPQDPGGPELAEAADRLRRADAFYAQSQPASEMSANVVAWLATAHERLENWPEALETYERACDAFEAIENLERVADLRFRMGAIAFGQADASTPASYDAAIEDLGGALELYARLAPNSLEAANTGGLLGLAHFEQGDVSEARARWEAALELFLANDPTPELAEVLWRLGVLELGQLDDSMHPSDELIARLKQARDLYDELDPESVARAAVRLDLAEAWRQRSDVSRALAELQAAREIYARADAVPPLADVQLKIGAIQLDEATDEDALTVAVESLRQAHELWTASDPNSTPAAFAARLLGQAYARQDNNAAAIELFEHAARLYKALDEKDGLATVLYEIGSTELGRADPSKPRAFARAVERLQAADALFQETAPASLEAANVAAELGDAYGSQHDRETAITHLERAQEIYRSLDLPDPAAAALVAIGWQHVGARELDLAREKFEEAAAQPGASREMRARAALLLAVVEVTGSDMVRAKEALADARELLRGNEPDSDVAWYELFVSAFIEEYEGQVREARERLRRARELAEQSATVDPERVALLDIRNAALDVMEGDYASAREKTEWGHDVFVRQSSEDVSSALNQLGSIDLLEGDPGRALSRFREVKERCERAGAESKVSSEYLEALDGMGRAFRIRGDIARARETLEDALRIRTEIDSVDIGETLFALGLVELEEGDPAMARDTLMRALQAQTRIATKSMNVAETRSALGEAARQADDLITARDELQLALEILEGISSQSAPLAETHYRLGLLCRAEDDPRQARDHLERARDLHEALAPNSVGIADVLYELGLLYDEEELDPALEHLERAFEVQRKVGPRAARSQQIRDALEGLKERKRDRDRPSHIFISYIRTDSKATVIPLARGLKKEYGAEVTVDLDFKPGENWRRKIADSVSSCDCTLIVIGKTWHTTKAEGSEVPKIEDPKEPVHEEIINALERRDDILVIPVLVENAKMPKLPSAITELADIEATKLRVDEWDADFERLARQATRRPGRLVAAVPAINSMR